MATPAEKLAESLNKLKDLQDNGVVAIKHDALSRTHRERLIANHFIEEVYKGWYIATSPNEINGSSTTWYSNYWEFCSQFLEDRFGDEWCISPEQSLLTHAGNKSVPQQLLVRSPKANNSKTALPYGTSLFLLKANIPNHDEAKKAENLRMYSLPAALINCSTNTFIQNPIDARAALALIKEPSEILSILLEGGHSVIAGRLSGAFRNNSQEKIADAILTTMKKVGYDVRETNPFETEVTVSFDKRASSPYGNRIRLMWMSMREIVMEHFPKSPGIPSDIKSYLKDLEDMYVTDAYHSLSIEKYKVTPELIEKVKEGNWSIKDNEEDRKQRDAMAARGYWDAFNAVKLSISEILRGKNPGEIADGDHPIWYNELFGPSVTAGLLKPSDLSGYRNHQVYIGNSMHTPLNKQAVRDAMPVLFELLTSEKEASVRAVLGHFIFVYIHPYMDGNGRMGRFLMNAMLASGGYPWTVIPVDERDAYMNALELASVDGDITAFAQFLGWLVSEGIKGNPVAKIKQ
ncbi:Fic family protein [Flavobacterium sp.]|uniref:Fic family protein n=1 Tax=Flavobacterium sp. TaxID=239 RepID=UPI003A90ED77